MAATETMVFFALMFSLLASSTTIAWIANDYAASPPCGINSACAPIDLHPTVKQETGPTISETYTTASGYDPNNTYPMDDALHGYGTWTQDSTGYHLTATGSLFGGDPILLLNGVLPTNNIYTVTYVIDNSPNGEFYITPRRTLANAQTELDIRLVFAADGIHIKKYPAPLPFFGNSDLYFITYPNAQDTKAGGSEYVVVFDEELNQVTVWKDGISMFAMSGLPDEIQTYMGQPEPGGAAPGETDDVRMGMGFYYGGVGSREVGFNVISTEAKRNMQHVVTGNAAQVSAWWWKGITDTLDSAIPGSGGVLEMLALISTVIAWTLPEAIFPLWANLLLIKTQGAALIYIGSRLARGGG